MISVPSIRKEKRARQQAKRCGEMIRTVQSAEASLGVERSAPKKTGIAPPLVREYGVFSEQHKTS